MQQIQLLNWRSHQMMGSELIIVYNNNVPGE